MALSEILAQYSQPISQIILDELRQDSHAFTRLITEAHIPLETLIALEPAMRNELRQDSHAFTRLITEARQTHRYLIINEIITEEQFVKSLLNQNRYLTIQNFVNENFLVSGTLPDGYQLKAENITDLIQLVKGVAEIRKNSRILAQTVNITSNTNRLFNNIPDALKAKISGFTGNDCRDETSVAINHYHRPGI